MVGYCFIVKIAKDVKTKNKKKLFTVVVFFFLSFLFLPLSYRYYVAYAKKAAI